MRFRVIIGVVCTMVAAPTALAESTFASREAFGQALFFDTNLSLNRSQSCATCHAPGTAFADGRDNPVGGAASLGDDGLALGDRNAPAIGYAHLVPEFGTNDQGEYIGGLFLDGRSRTLAEQAGEPFLNPLEMALPDERALTERVLENPDYVAALQQFFAMDDDHLALDVFNAVTASIAAFERSPLFSTFDSRYDRYVRGEIALTPEEEIGRMLFFSQLISCHGCHLADMRESVPQELFTNHKYSNIGIPVNQELRQANGVREADTGLARNPHVEGAGHAGKFRVPSLRNVAVTAPYMHNGIFQTLEAAILFYDKYTLQTAQSTTNPETGEPWGLPEVDENLDLSLLRQGQPVTPRRAKALAAFLRTLTDRRYESMLDSPELQ